MQHNEPRPDEPAERAKQGEARCEHVRIVRDLLDPDSDGLGEDTYRIMELYIDGQMSLDEFADEMGAPFLIMSLPDAGQAL